MNLEEIITAAVEKRVTELVESAVYRYRQGADPSSVEQTVALMVEAIASEEVQKHKERIHAAVAEALNSRTCGIELKAYATILLPEVK